MRLLDLTFSLLIFFSTFSSFAEIGEMTEATDNCQIINRLAGEFVCLTRDEDGTIKGVFDLQLEPITNENTQGLRITQDEKMPVEIYFDGIPVILSPSGAMHTVSRKVYCLENSVVIHFSTSFDLANIDELESEVWKSEDNFQEISTLSAGQVSLVSSELNGSIEKYQCQERR